MPTMETQFREQDLSNDFKLHEYAKHHSSPANITRCLRIGFILGQDNVTDISLGIIMRRLHLRTLVFCCVWMIHLVCRIFCHGSRGVRVPCCLQAAGGSALVFWVGIHFGKRLRLTNLLVGTTKNETHNLIASQPSCLQGIT